MANLGQLARRVAATAITVSLAACGGDDGTVSTLNLQIHGPDDGPSSSTIGFPESVDRCVSSLRFRSHQGTTFLAETEVDWDASPATLPKLGFGSDNWISVEGISSGDTGCPGAGEVAASGSTSRFSWGAKDVIPPQVHVLTGVPLRFQPAFWFNPDSASSVELLYELPDQERAGHTVTALEDGSGYLVVGGAKMGGAGIAGSGITGLVDTVEFYDAYTGQFLTVYEDGCAGDTQTCALRVPGGGTAFHTATSMEDGRVLIAGGLRRTGSGDALVPSADVFVLEITGQAEGTLTPVPYGGTAFPMERAFHTATRMGDGRVLLIGGIGRTYAPSPIFQSEVYQVAPQAELEVTDSGADLSVPRALHTSTYFDAFSHGVIVVGGRGNSGPVQTSEVIFAESAGASFDTPLAVDVFNAGNSSSDLQVPRFGHGAVKYSCPGSDDEYLAIIGGYTAAGDTLLAGSEPTAVVEVYLPRSRFEGAARYAFSDATATLPSGGRAFGLALSLPLSGDVMYVGGIDGGGAVVDAADRLFQQNWNQCDVFEIPQRVDQGLTRGRAHAAGLVLSNGFGFVTGGFDGTASLESSEFYNPGDYSLVKDFF